MGIPSNISACIVGDLKNRESLTPEIWDCGLAGGEFAMVVTSAVQLLIFITSLPLNFFVALGIIFKRLLNQPTYILIFNLAAVDLLLTFTFILFNIITGFSGHYSFGDADYVRCQVCRFVSICILLYFVSSMTLALISLDQLAFFKIPLKYHIKVTPRRAVFAVIGAWLLGVALIVPPLFGYGDVLFSMLCGYIFLSAQHIENSIHHLVITASVLTLIMTVSVVTNIWIVCIALKQHRALKKIITQVHLSESDTLALAQQRNEIQRANKRIAGKQFRLFLMFGGIVIIHCLTFLPLIITAVLLVAAGWIPVFLFYFSLVGFTSQVVLHPIIVAFFTPEIPMLLPITRGRSAEVIHPYSSLPQPMLGRVLGMAGGALGAVGVGFGSVDATAHRMGGRGGCETFCVAGGTMRAVDMQLESVMGESPEVESLGEGEVMIQTVAVEVEPAGVEVLCKEEAAEPEEGTDGGIPVLNLRQLCRLALEIPSATNPLTESPIASPVEVDGEFPIEHVNGNRYKGTTMSEELTVKPSNAHYEDITTNLLTDRLTESPSNSVVVNSGIPADVNRADHEDITTNSSLTGELSPGPPEFVMANGDIAANSSQCMDTASTSSSASDLVIVNFPSVQSKDTASNSLNDASTSDSVVVSPHIKDTASNSQSNAYTCDFVMVNRGIPAVHVSGACGEDSATDSLTRGAGNTLPSVISRRVSARSARPARRIHEEVLNRERALRMWSGSGEPPY